MPFPDRQTKDKILNNYEYGTSYNAHYDDGNDDAKVEDEDDNFDEISEKVKNFGLNEDEKAKVIEYYEVFKDDLST